MLPSAQRSRPCARIRPGPRGRPTLRWPPMPNCLASEAAPIAPHLDRRATPPADGTRALHVTFQPRCVPLSLTLACQRSCILTYVCLRVPACARCPSPEHAKGSMASSTAKRFCRQPPSLTLPHHNLICHPLVTHTLSHHPLLLLTTPTRPSSLPSLVPSPLARPLALPVATPVAPVGRRPSQGRRIPGRRRHHNGLLPPFAHLHL